MTTGRWYTGTSSRTERDSEQTERICLDCSEIRERFGSKGPVLHMPAVILLSDKNWNEV